MTDVPVGRPNDQFAQSNGEERRNSFFSGLLQESLGIMQLNSVLGVRDDVPLNMLFGAGQNVPEVSISNSGSNSYPYFDPYDFGGDPSPKDNLPQNPQPEPNRPDAPAPPAPSPDAPPAPGPSPDAPPAPEPAPDAPPAPAPSPDAPPAPAPSPDAPPDAPPPAPPPADRQEKMGDRMFTIHPDGSAEYTVVKGDCVWYVATDVLKARNGAAPNDAQIVEEVNAISKASGLTVNGRNPDLIYPGDKLVVPAPAKPDDEPPPPQK